MDHIAAIRDRSDLMVASARAAGLDTPVPSCPGWDVHELVFHTGKTHRRAITMVAARSTEYLPTESGPVPEARADTLDWFAGGADTLVELLQNTDPETPIWSWGPDQTARFWSRRMAHETAVHGWDAAAAAGDPGVLPADLAADGIDEQLELLPGLLAVRPESASLRGAGETIHLHAVDAEGEWLIRLTPDGIEWTREHAKGDVAARGTASDLNLFVLGRIPPDRLEVFGDGALLERWQRDFNF